MPRDVRRMEFHGKPDADFDSMGFTVVSSVLLLRGATAAPEPEPDSQEDL